MSATSTAYIPFSRLSLEWARVSGMPTEMVLRRLCEWAVAGVFPKGAFINAVGNEIATLDIYMSFLAATAKSGARGQAIHLSGYTYLNNGQWGIDLLNEAMISSEHVSEFCERTDTVPPPSLLSGFRRVWMRSGRRKHLAPPPCPDGVAYAERIAARDNAIGFMNSLRSMLAGLQGKRTIFGPHRISDEVPDFDFWEPRWKGARECCEDNIRRSGDRELQEELAAMDAEWAAFERSRPQSRAKSASRAKEADQTPYELSGRSVETGSERRPRGRPPGAGSYEAADAPLVEEMRNAILSEPNLSLTAAALRVVDRAAGGGTCESKAKRLAERYSEKYKA